MNISNRKLFKMFICVWGTKSLKITDFQGCEKRKVLILQGCNLGLHPYKKSRLQLPFLAFATLQYHIKIALKRTSDVRKK